MKALTDLSDWEERLWSTRRPERLRWLYRDQDYETVRLIRQAIRGCGDRVIEVGGGGSRILPYLGRGLSTPVAANDFSMAGCRLLRANLGLQGVCGDAVREDFLQSSLASERFDVVYSCGLIEHFDDQLAAVAAHVRLLKPNGRLVLTVPNLEGIQGNIFRRLAPKRWAMHAVFGPEGLAEVLRRLGLADVRCGYLGSFYLHVDSGPGWTGVNAWPIWKQKLICGSVRLARAGLSLFFRILPWRPHSRSFSPSFFVIGVKPER